MKKDLSALACERHQFGTLSDSRCPGLRLVATLKKKAWIYRYRLHTGGVRQIKLGEFSRMKLAEAREVWAIQKKVRDSRLDPRNERKEAIQAEVANIQRAYTVDEMFADWIRLHATDLARGREMERLVRREILPKWKRRAVGSITRRDCVDLFELISARAPRIAEQVMSAVRSAFTLAAKRARVDVANPAAGVGSMKRSERKRAFVEAELKLFLAWLSDGSLSENVKDVMHLTLLTACRSGEACNAEWSEVDLAAGVWAQPEGKTKNGRGHRVMLARQAANLLQARREQHTRWLFPSRDSRPILQKAIGFAQWEQKDRCPVKDWTVHDLRRTALTGLARMGCPRVVQDRISNHTDRSMAAIYDVHSYDEEAREWLQKWADYLDGLASKATPTSLRPVRSASAEPEAVACA